MIPPNIFIEGYTLADCWAKAVRETMKNGVILPSEYGPRSRDVCSTIVVKYPYIEPVLHPQFPTKSGHLLEYIKQFERSYDWKKQGFVYTYLDRLTKYPAKGTNLSNPYEVIEMDQLKYLKEQLEKPITRRAQIITWVPEMDMYNDEPPCLQRIWMRKLSPTTAEIHCDWRSRDLFAAWNSNYIAILAMIKKEILIPLNLNLVKLVDFCDSLHIYEGNWEEASKVNLVPVNPMLMR